MKKGDWIKIKYGRFKNKVGRIVSHKVDDDYVVAFEDGEMVTFHPGALDVVEPFVVSLPMLKRIARGTLSYDDISAQVFPAFNVKAEKKYKMKADDIRSAFIHIKEKENPLEEFKRWFWIILNVFYEALSLDTIYDKELFDDFPKTEKEIFSTVFGIAEKLYWSLEERFGQRENEEQYFIKFVDEPVWEKNDEYKNALEKAAFFGVSTEIIDRVDSFAHNKNLPQGAWIYSKSQMKHVLSEYKSASDLKKSSPEAKALFKKFVFDLYALGDMQAARILGYSYFEGGPVFRQNWNLAYKYISEVYEKTGDSYAATALGYIYYFGKCNDGIAQYDKAFEMFSYAALDGIEEAILRTGDMLVHGQGTKKNVEMGVDLIVDGYKNTLEEFCQGKFDNKFAEYAVLMGNISRERLIYEMGMRDTYRFYLEALFALKKRKKARFSGDDIMQENVEKELRKISDEMGLDTKRTILKADFPIYINQLYDNHIPVRVTIEKKKNVYKLKAKRIQLSDIINFDLLEKTTGIEAEQIKQEMNPKLLVTYPELSYTNLVSEIEFTLENVAVAEIKVKGNSFVSDALKKNEATGALEFYASGVLTAAVDAEWYIIKIKR